MFVPVDLIVEDTLLHVPVEGALVKVFAADGKTSYGEMVTGPEGIASFLLDGPQRYQIRAFKISYSFSNPLYIDVDPDVSNCFTIPCTSIAIPSSTDPRMCMCSGTFRQPTGAPAQGVDIHFITRFHPLLLDGAAILTERVEVRTDSNGWVQLQLVRGGQFDVIMEGYEDVKRTITVPDSSSCNLPDLIFETPASVVLPFGSITIPVGQTVEVSPQVFTSVGRLLDGTAREYVCWNVSDTSVASMTLTWDKIILYGSSPGTCSLSATRRDTSVVRIPDSPILLGIPIQVV